MKNHFQQSHHLHPWAKNCSMKDHQLTISNLILKDIAPILGAHRAPYFTDFWWICSLLNLCRRGFNAIQLLGKMSHPRGVPPRKPQGQKIYLRCSAVHLCISTSVKRNQKSKFWSYRNVFQAHAWKLTWTLQQGWQFVEVPSQYNQYSGVNHNILNTYKTNKRRYLSPEIGSCLNGYKLRHIQRASQLLMCTDWMTYRNCISWRSSEQPLCRGKWNRLMTLWCRQTTLTLI